jgi:hypothetical protein
VGAPPWRGIPIYLEELPPAGPGAGVVDPDAPDDAGAPLFGCWLLGDDEGACAFESIGLDDPDA